VWGIDRHLAVIGCGLIAAAGLGFAAGGVTTLALMAAPRATLEVELPTSALAPLVAAEPGPPPAAPATRPAVLEPAAAPSSAPVAATGSFVLQVGSFLDPAAAAVLVAQLEAAGYSAALAATTDRAGRTWHAAQAGSFQRRGDAQAAAIELERRLGLAATIVALGADATP
jgi:cell division septation protein DedD